MKKYLLAFVFLLVVAAGFSQPKPTKKEKPPTAKEMEEMQKEMEKAMNEMSPEDKKMMDSMGFKLPSMPTMPKMTDKQIAAAMEEENRIVPVKDVARIAKISKPPLANSAVPAYLNTVHADIISKLNPKVNEGGEKVYQWLKKKYNSAIAIGNAAVGLCMMGRPDIALYVMSKACKDDPGNADNLNNFSALLTMEGGEQHAIPLLENLNRRFPRNSTILNNLGQAWFGLGEINLAEKYLDSCVRIYPAHSQANATKSLLYENKGDKANAIEALRKSIKEGYTPDKENRLSKLGYKLKSDDIGWNDPMPQDPLGLEKFNWPDYPLSAEASEKLEPEWQKFIEQCESQINELSEKQKRLEQELQAATQKRMKDVMEAGYRGTMVDPFPPLAQKAVIKLKYLVDGKDGKLAFDQQRQIEELAKKATVVADLEVKYSHNLEEVKKKYEPLFGEGKENPIERACKDENKVKDAFLKQANEILMERNTAFLDFMRRLFNDRMYYNQYTQWPEQFEFSKVQTQIMWLNLIKDQKVKFQNKSAWCQDNLDEEAQDDSLANFEDMHCDYHSEIIFPGMGYIKSDCSLLSAKLDLSFLKETIGLDILNASATFKQGDRDDESLLDQLQNWRIEFGVKESKGFGQGPVRAELKGGVAGFLEGNGLRITDAGAILSADVTLGTNFIKQMEGTETYRRVKTGEEAKYGAGPIKDKSLSIVGFETQMSISAGLSGKGKGVLNRVSYGPDGIQIKNPK